MLTSFTGLVSVEPDTYDVQLLCVADDVGGYLPHVDDVALAEIEVSMLVPLAVYRLVWMAFECPLGEIVVGVGVELLVVLAPYGV